MTIENKRTVIVQNDVSVHFVPEEISALHRALDILKGIADPDIYPDYNIPLYSSDWSNAAYIIAEILEEAERNNSKVFLYREEDGES